MSQSNGLGNGDEVQVFVFELLMGVSSLAFAGYLGYKMGAFTDITVDLVAVPLVGGTVVGTLSVLGLESETVRALYENPVIKTIVTVVVISCIAVVVWLFSRTASAQAVYAAMSLIIASLATRSYVFVRRTERTSE